MTGPEPMEESANAAGSRERAPSPGSGPGLQYTLGSLLVCVTICSVAMSFYHSLGPAMVAFIIGFSALMLYAVFLMGRIRACSPTTIELASDLDARFCRDLLRERGIPAQIAQQHMNPAFPLPHRGAQIIVPAAEAERARALLAERERKN